MSRLDALALITENRPAAWRACLGGWSPVADLTLPRTADDQQFWAATIWQLLISRAITDSWLATRSRRIEGLLAMDHLLDEQLGKSVAASRMAGAGVLRRFSPLRGDKFWRAFAQEVLVGRSPGHLAVLVGCRAAVFHFPPLAAHEVVLAAELRSQGVSAGDARFLRWLDLVKQGIQQEKGMQAA
ncbi:MAG: hypothetical protein Fur0032_18150 [Terrimicrobiaceae bacterium]